MNIRAPNKETLEEIGRAWQQFLNTNPQQINEVFISIKVRNFVFKQIYSIFGQSHTFYIHIFGGLSKYFAIKCSRPIHML